MSYPAIAPWKHVKFDGCGHIEWIYPEEYGDGSAWCSRCGSLQTYDVAGAMEANACAECGNQACGPASSCAECGHVDWREDTDYVRAPMYA